jgi:hypothetical protein
MIPYEDLIIGKEYKIKSAYYKEKVRNSSGGYYRRGREYLYNNCILTSKRLMNNGLMRLEVQLGEGCWKEFTLPVENKKATGVIDIEEIEYDDRTAISK